MKLLAFAALTLLAPKADIRFEADGLRIDGVLVQGRVLEMKGAGSTFLLASGSSIEALTSSLEIDLAPDRSLVLEPGVRVTRADGGYRFSVHRNAPLRFSASKESITLHGPVLVSATPEGWQVGDRKIAGRTLQAGLLAQDDAESNLDKMLRSKEKMQSAGVGKLSNRTTRLFRGDPLTNGQASNSISVRQVMQVSPDGSP